MNLKDLFDKADGGVLSYEQLMQAAGQSKFVDLTEGGYVSKQKYTDDLAARDTRITTLDDTIKARDTDLASLKEQLAAAGTDTAKLQELTGNLSELQKKYDKDTKALEKQLKDQAYRHAVNEFANAQKFTSKAAKRDFIAALTSKNLTVENDIIVGATDFVSAYQKENADAFVVEDQNNGGASAGTKPKFAGGTGDNGGAGADENNPFNFNFVGVRSKEK